MMVQAENIDDAPFQKCFKDWQLLFRVFVGEVFLADPLSILTPQISRIEV